MNYEIRYDVGDRKRDSGINEDSVAVSVFEDGHREGLVRQPGTEASDAADGSESADAADANGPDAADATEPDDDDANEQDDGAEATDAEGGTGAADSTDAPDNRTATVFALADGAGGHDAGDAAAYLATTTVCQHLAATAIGAVRSDPEAFDVAAGAALDPRPRDDDIEAAVAEAVVAAHREVLAYAAESGRQAHTTVVAGVCVDGRLHYGWVGDSRAYLINGAREEIVPLTSDHAVVERLREAGRIDDVEALVHPRGNEITRALGGSAGAAPETATVEVDTATVPIYAEDVVLATSDGLVDAQTEAAKLYEWYVEADRDAETARIVRDRAVTDGEIRDRVLGADSLSAAAEDLLALANDRGGKDNLSTLLLHDPSLPATPDEVPPRAVGAEPDVEERQTVVGGD